MKLQNLNANFCEVLLDSECELVTGGAVSPKAQGTIAGVINKISTNLTEQIAEVDPPANGTDLSSKLTNQINFVASILL